MSEDPKDTDDECYSHGSGAKKGSNSTVGYDGKDYIVMEYDKSEPVLAIPSIEAACYELNAVVKAGTEREGQEIGSHNEFTVENIDKEAISNVRFYCNEDAANSTAESGPDLE